MVETVDISVIQRAVSVEFECPHCRDDARFSYSDFVGMVGEPCDWNGSKI